MTNLERKRLKAIAVALLVLSIGMTGGYLFTWFILQTHPPTLYGVVGMLLNGTLSRIGYLLEVIPGHAERSMELGSSEEKKIVFRNMQRIK